MYVFLKINFHTIRQFLKKVFDYKILGNSHLFDPQSSWRNRNAEK